jgi:glutamate-5-semialdehyde dehydrogenase
VPSSAPPSLVDLGLRAKAAGRLVARSSSAVRADALRFGADLIGDRSDRILAANAGDVARAVAEGADDTSLDRLCLDAGRVAAMAEGLRDVAALADPVGEVVEGWMRPNGLRVERVRIPLGVIGIIYENRPNVTSDAAGLCLKSGNAVLLRGSSSAVSTNQVVAAALRDGLAKADLPVDAVCLVEDTTRAGAVEFMQLKGIIDCLIPRGGTSLIASVEEHATVPFVVDGIGNCHVYVDASADLDMAESIVVNAKTQRPGVCNAAESLVVHRDVAAVFLPRIAEALSGVTLLGDEATRAILPGIGAATERDFAVEFLGTTMSVATVDDLDAALDHITRYGSGHSEAIVTRDIAAAGRFTTEIDAAAVVVNASTRFVDGGELGLGAEIGISTQKLHARGPMGLRELTSIRYIVTGTGQVRT